MDGVHAEAPVERVVIFDAVEYGARLSRVRAEMEGAGLDALLLVAPENVFYLSGYQTMEGAFPFLVLVVPRVAAPYLVMRALNLSLARYYAVVDDIESIEDGGDAQGALFASLQRRGLAQGRIGIEEKSPWLSAALWRALSAALPGLCPASGLVERVRAVKSARELEYMRVAASLTDAGMHAALAEVAEGCSENDVAAAAFDAMTRAGSEFMPIAPLIVAGERSAVVHTSYRRRLLGMGDSVFCELAGVYNRYCTPLMRSAFIGPQPAVLEERAALAAEALAAGEAQLRPGTEAGEVEAAYRAVLERAGLGTKSGGPGYSVGIAFQSFPEKGVLALSRGVRTPLATGMCVFIGVNLRVPGVGLTSASDTFIITAEGAEPLSRVPRAPLRI